MLELVRITVPFFKKDQKKWAAHDKAALFEQAHDQNVESKKVPVESFDVQQVDGSVVAKS